ncbi:MAG: hypothetical protein GXP14_11905 [Gammaproteobacteria bacterium]|nr:hypothetical protein [Gammaproteobacteria bacterium]
MGVYSFDKLISEARKLATDFRKGTGKPLAGISSEIAEYDAAKLLDLDLGKAGEAGGYDAVGRGHRKGKRIQIKGRVITDDAKRGQRIGQLKVEQEWDSVVLVLMNEEHKTYAIYEAGRETILEALNDAQHRSRNKKGAMSIAKFKIISDLIWSDETKTT